MFSTRSFLSVAAVLTVVSVGASGTASAGYGGVHLVSHVAHASPGTGVHAVKQRWTVVTSVTGVAPAVSHRIAWDIDRRTSHFVVPPSNSHFGPFDLEDIVGQVRA